MPETNRIEYKSALTNLQTLLLSKMATVETVEPATIASL